MLTACSTGTKANDPGEINTYLTWGPSSPSPVPGPPQALIGAAWTLPSPPIPQTYPYTIVTCSFAGTALTLSLVSLLRDTPGLFLSY